MGEMYKEWRVQKKEKKVINLRNNLNMLNELGITYSSKNNGIHLQLNGENGIVDFYPTTSRWIARSGICGTHINYKFKEVMGIAK